MELKLKLGNKTIDLADSMPLTIGDWKAFEKKKLITKDGQVAAQGASQVCILLLHLAQKVDKTITEKDIESLPLEELPRLTKWVEESIKVEQEEGQEVDHPS